MNQKKIACMENDIKNGSLVYTYLDRSKNEQKFTNEDLVGIFVPILKELEYIHDQGKVGLYRGLDSFSQSLKNRLIINGALIKDGFPNLYKINKVLPDNHGGFDIISEQEMISDLSNQQNKILDKAVVEEIPDQILAPILLPGYISYETILGHHDPSTDLQVCGLLMASLALSLDLRDKEDVKSLQIIIKNPVNAGTSVHPNIFRLILDMIQLDRRDRVRDASAARIRLENYLEYSSSNQEDFDDVIQSYTKKDGNRKSWILSRLRNRLFDLSKRNRLIYFKKSARYVNLTLSSVPYVVDYKNIRIEKLFIWNETIAAKLSNGKPIKLQQYLKIKENPQIAISLKKVYYEGNRDKAEYGFNQLKLAFCFLNWYNYKENPKEKIHSPLLLLPATLKKKKGIKDEFTLETHQTEAQVNPVLSYYLKELYDIRLPKYYDLASQSIEQIHEDISKIIRYKSNEVKLEMILKPRMRLIHSLAKRSYESYQKKIRASVSKSIWGGREDYSYNYNDYRPLGVRLFRNRVEENASVLEFLIDSNVKIAQNVVDNDVHQAFYQIESDGSVNPYNWEFDLCNFTLGNFNYQRMTLVNDYDSLLEEDVENNIFEDLFSDNPKKNFDSKSSFTHLENNYTVIPADPTQLHAIEQANELQSYIIQGPPGTGKSQTIVNLLANKVAHGKSVLFISEKRAALDVVYARMSQVGLQDLCTLIHDSQSDKKAFIFDLKDTYEKYKDEANALAQIIEKRKHITDRIKGYLKVIQSFCDYQKSSPNDIVIRDVIDIIISKQILRSSIDPRLIENAPSFKEWQIYKPILSQLNKSIKEQTSFKDLASCPYLFMDSRVSSGNSNSFVTDNCDRLEDALSYLQSRMQAVFGDSIDTIDEIQLVMEKLYPIEVLYRLESLDLLDPNSSITEEYRGHLTAMKSLNAQLVICQEKTKNWRQKPSKDELKRLYNQYQGIKSGFFNKLWNRKSQFIQNLSKYYDFGAHMIPPEPEELFRDLQVEISLLEKIDSYKKKTKFDIVLSEELIASAKSSMLYFKDHWKLKDILRQESFKSLLNNYSELRDTYHRMIEAKKNIIQQPYPIDELYDIIDELRLSSSSLFSLAPRLKEWYEIPLEWRAFIGNSKLSEDEIEYVTAYHFLLETQYQSGAEITGAEIGRITQKISDLYPVFLELNSQYIVAYAKKKVQDSLNLSTVSSRELTKEQVTLKKQYHKGRTVLENEFGKKMRYKSIRELASNSTGVVVKDLKPIWMMSPLSVSDTLPLEAMFDIVIFDEASQITVEEGIPPLYRADQAIIVGDEMQMPPSNFFSTRIDESDEEAEFLSMDAESLLNQGARKLPQVTLGWHYRSKQEALINFSNFAFYKGELLTIPDVDTSSKINEPIEIFEKEEAVNNMEVLLQSSITYHYIPNGVYHNRMNDSEAEYIASMVRELLISKVDKTIGIVAFSMQQQSNIESALNRLALEDSVFGVLLEESYLGKENEEFTGLFVKNLENVQGDERDIMILSICFAYNNKGRMLMNFGPINRRGGEKRLNVIFSRAKQHMAVVSSIKYIDITNDYNEGANYLKKYLQYSELISKGEHEAATAILRGLSRKSNRAIEQSPTSMMCRQITNALENRGYYVYDNLGQSRLKINLGVKKKKNQDHYDLGVIVDSTDSYKNNDLLNQYYITPNILKTFGWKLYHVYASDWLKNQNVVVSAIVSAIETKESKKETRELFINKNGSKENNNVDDGIIDDCVDPSLEMDNEAQNRSTTILSDREIEAVEISKEETNLVHLRKNKFWGIVVEGKTITIKIGNIGQEGIVSHKYFESNREAMDYYKNQVASRKSRDYKNKE